jgi:replicative DNA helicase
MRTDPYIPKEYERLTSISRNLKKITQVLKVPVLAISHLNREVDKRDKHRPRLSDLRGSGSIEQDADIVLLLHREDQYRKQSDPNIDPNDFDGIAELIIAKNRHGRTGIAKLLFREEYTHFVNMTPEYLGEQEQ